MPQQKTLSDLADLTGGTVSGDTTYIITGVQALDHAGESEISFLAPGSDQSQLEHTRAGAVVVQHGTPYPEKNLLLVDDPYLAITLIHNDFLNTPFQSTGIHPSAVIGDGCTLADTITVGPGVVIGDNTTVESEVVIGANVVIGAGCFIGHGSVIHPNATLYADTVIGKRVILHSGTVIGSDGFGYASSPDGTHLKRPHVGRVVIEDDVEIGANSCIDRATFGTTTIHRGTKIDNLVQVGHNVAIGKNSLVVAQVGIAGSTTIGSNVIIGGQAGISGHITLGDGTMVAAQAGVHNSLDAKSIVSGTPAIAHRKFMRVAAALPRLPDMLKELRALRLRLATQDNNKQKD